MQNLKPPKAPAHWDQRFLVIASNIAGWDDSTNNVVGGILTVTSPNTFEFVAPSLASMNDVNVSITDCQISKQIHRSIFILTRITF